MEETEAEAEAEARKATWKLHFSTGWRGERKQSFPWDERMCEKGGETRRGGKRREGGSSVVISTAKTCASCTVHCSSTVYVCRSFVFTRTSATASEY